MSTIRDLMSVREIKAGVPTKEKNSEKKAEKNSKEGGKQVVRAGGPGSGCNPDAGHCGRHPGEHKDLEGLKKNAKMWQSGKRSDGHSWDPKTAPELNKDMQEVHDAAAKVQAAIEKGDYKGADQIIQGVHEVGKYMLYSRVGKLLNDKLGKSKERSSYMKKDPAAKNLTDNDEIVYFG